MFEVVVLLVFVEARSCFVLKNLVRKMFADNSLLEKLHVKHAACLQNEDQESNDSSRSDVDVSVLAFESVGLSLQSGCS